MNRRSFFKTIAGFVAGAVAAVAPGNIEKDGENFIIDFPPALRPRMVKRREGMRVMKFDEPVQSIEKYNGRCMVICEHSIWEITVDDEKILRSKLVKA